ncbi:MAG: hypothetical protein MZW92_12855 [Comamonadaceae bacterium]|nr:hypothetical protein [Comamonadaceae bacterium]
MFRRLTSREAPENRLPPGFAAQGKRVDGKSADIKKAAQEFEAVFVSYLLKVMRETIEESGESEGGFGKTIYTELFDQELSEASPREADWALPT